MSLENLFNDIAVVIARGTSQDSKIPRWVRMANNWLETNYDFEHMFRSGELWLDPDAEFPNMVDLPNDRVKMVTLVMPFKDELDGSRAYLGEVPKMDRAQAGGLGFCAPTGWWKSGNQMAFNAKPKTRYDFEIDYVEYTAWPTSASATPTMLAKYENLLFSAALVHAFRELKDEGAFQVWTATRNEALTPVLQAEEEAKWKGRQFRMGMGRG